MTAALQNPWLNFSAAIPFPAEQEAVALTQPPSAAADLSPSNEGGYQGAPVVPQPNTVTTGATDLLGSDISDVGNIFTYARWLVAQARIEPGKYSPEAVAVAEEIRDYEDIYDPPPLFLQTPGGILQVLRGR